VRGDEQGLVRTHRKLIPDRRRIPPGDYERDDPRAHPRRCDARRSRARVHRRDLRLGGVGMPARRDRRRRVAWGTARSGRAHLLHHDATQADAARVEALDLVAQ
jgi:hypothetical protein